MKAQRNTNGLLEPSINTRVVLIGLIDNVDFTANVEVVEVSDK